MCFVTQLKYYEQGKPKTLELFASFPTIKYFDGFDHANACSRNEMEAITHRFQKVVRFVSNGSTTYACDNSYWLMAGMGVCWNLTYWPDARAINNTFEQHFDAIVLHHAQKTLRTLIFRGCQSDNEYNWLHLKMPNLKRLWYVCPAPVGSDVHDNCTCIKHTALLVVIRKRCWT